MLCNRMVPFVKLLTICLLSALYFSTAGAQSVTVETELTNLKRQLDEIRDTQKRMQKDLQELQLLLRRMTGHSQTPPPQINLNVETNPFKGNENTKLVLIEFTDYQCPYCGRHVRETLPQIQKHYIETGKLKYVFWDFPLERIHRDAFKAHEAAHCAGEQGRYWDMHNRLFANQHLLAVPELLKHAELIALDRTQFQQCLDSGQYVNKIRRDISEAQSIGVNGTPTYILGLQSSDKQVTRLLAIFRGAQPYMQFKDAIEKVLGEVN